MEESKSSEALKYEQSRLHFRSEARKEFFAQHKKSNIAVAAMNEVVAKHMGFLNKRNLSAIENGQYYGDLIVSFTRTHFIVIDLVVSSELIDAAILFRKQMELMSRLEELAQGKHAKELPGKTPNIRNLEFNLNRLYAEYSTISHSSGLKQFQLLGNRETQEGVYSLVYPEFQRNAYASLYHLFLLVTQYHFWVRCF